MAAPVIPKPRLVAKSAASLSNLSKVRSGAPSPAGPDASKVWNKNRVAPPAPPKQFTDEELKQQYGIHLATRLQSDENGKESKWADIDDDEDDWAPDTVVWMDGTKSTLAPAEAVPPPQEERPTSPAPSKPAEAPKPIILATKPQSEVSGPPKTILKPGAAIQAKQSGAATPSAATDKHILKAKSPAPAPAKSPWAPLPPVEKVSPINPPVQPFSHHPAQFASQDARAYEEPMAPPQPAREIAADTFNRSWREGEGERRELFNSVNGRYEPAPEGRRSSVRSDNLSRKPALLQRPSHSSTSPAEPSTAFQSRSNAQEGYGAWSRRRGSSVSQASGPSARRMSVNKGHETIPVTERQGSTPVGADMPAATPDTKKEVGQPAFSQQSAWAQQLPPPPPPGQEVEDPVKVQERIMREKREAARRRRQEDEEREEIERKERLKAKLAALEGAGKSKKERQEAAVVLNTATETPSSEKGNDLATSVAPVSEQKGEGADMIPPAEAHILPRGQDATVKTPAVPEAPFTTASQPPASAGARAPESPSKTPEVLAPISKTQDTAQPVRQSLTGDESQLPAQGAHPSPISNSRSPLQPQVPSPYRTAQSSAFSSPGDRGRKPQPFTRSPMTSSDTFTPWLSTGPSGNVWGTSGIGNGTFESSSSFAPLPILQQQSSTLPLPPGMTRPAAATRIPSQGIGQDSRSPSLQAAQTAEQPRAFPPIAVDSRSDHFNQSRVTGVPPSPSMGRQQHVPGPIAPPSRAQQQQAQPQGTRTDGVSGWKSAAQRLPNQYIDDVDAADKIGLEETTPVQPKKHTTFKETFRQTSNDQSRLGSPRNFVKAEFTVHDAQGSRPVTGPSPAPPSAQTQPSDSPSIGSPLNDLRKQPGDVRIPDGSLNPAHGGVHAPQHPIAPPTKTLMQPHVSNAKFTTGPLAPGPAANDQSPPPPEIMSHPVFGDDSNHPNVKLPLPPPVVKLPPASMTASKSSTTSATIPQRPVQNWGPVGAPRPLVHSEAWQARFNGLFNRTPIQTETPPSPPKTPPKLQGPALAVSSASRAPMDDLAAPVIEATVSLPLARSNRGMTPEGFSLDDSSETTSKAIMEQMFNEELGFGSRPMVRVPRNANYGAVDFGDVDILTRRRIAQYSGPVDSQSKRDVPNFTLFHKKNDGIFVKLPGTSRNRLVLHRQGSRQPLGMINKIRGPIPAGKYATPSPQVPSAPKGPAETRKPSAYKVSHSPSSANKRTPASAGNRKRSGLGKPAKSPQQATPVGSN